MGTDSDYHVAPDVVTDTAVDESAARAGSPPLTCLFCGNALDVELLEWPDALCSRCESPLAPVQQRRPERTSRRMLRRVDTLMPVRIRIDWSDTASIDGMMQNLSLNGMRFESPVALEPNKLIRIDAAPCRALGRVTHCAQTESGLYSTGIEFVTVLFTATDDDSGGRTR